MSTVTEQPASRTQGAHARLPWRPIVFATAFGLLLNLAMELLEPLAVPGMAADLGANVAFVTGYSLVGMLAAIGLAALARGRARVVVALVAGVVGAVLVYPMFWAAVPLSFSAAGWALSRPVTGLGRRTAWILAIVGAVAFVIVSISMFPFSEL